MACQLDISKTLTYEFWYDYIKPKYQNNAKLFYMDTDSFITHIKTEDFYKDIADDVKKWFYTSNYSEDNKRPLPRGMKTKVMGLWKDELGGKIMIEFFDLRPKTYSDLTDNDNNVKKAKGTQKYVITRILKFNDYKDFLFKNEIILKSQQWFKCEAHNMHTEEINNIGNDDKILQTFDRITSYPYGTNAFEVWESEMLLKYKWLILMIIQMNIIQNRT